MKLLASLLAGLLLGIFPSLAGAGCTNEGCSELKDLSSVRIEANANEAAEDYLGLTEQRLGDLALVVLRAKLPRIKIVSTEESFAGLGELYPGFFATGVFVNLTVIRHRFSGQDLSAASAFLQVEVAEITLIRANFVKAVLWESDGRIMVAGNLSELKGLIQDGIEEALIAFAADWNRANPDK